MTSPLLAIENLSVGFRQQQHVRPVVNAISLQVNAGETLALVGESGSGKSVTALSILRLLPTPPAVYLSGDIRFTANHCFMPASRRYAACAAIKSP